jgi:hypothetical protein
MSALRGKAALGRLSGLMVHNPPGENQGHPGRDFSYLAYFGIHPGCLVIKTGDMTTGGVHGSLMQ